jgi:hypothetical protein
MRPYLRLAAIGSIIASVVPTVQPRSAGAQTIPFSQRGSVQQDVGFTSLTVTYGRPVARGRNLFGELVPWDSVWHPGADSASRLTTSRDITIEGRELKAGAYSLWLIPRRDAPWTLIVSRADRVFHSPYPGAGQDFLRVDIATQQTSHMETLAFYFPSVVRDEAELRIHWGTTYLPIRIKAPYRPGG